MCPIQTSQNGLESDPLHLIFCNPFPTCHSMEMQEVEKKELPEESKATCFDAFNSPRKCCHQPYSDDKFAFDEPELGLGLDGACGCSQAKEDEIPTNLPGSFCVHCPHNLYRLRKVIREDRLYRHILVETRRRALLWNTDIRSVSKPSSFSCPWSCLCYPGPSVKTFDPDLL